jgi:RNA polymerase sigma factor (sigma-70 family)
VHGTRGVRNRTTTEPIGLERVPYFLAKPPITADKPLFDRGRFVTSPTAHRPAPADENEHSLAKLLKGTNGPSGGLLSATWEGGNKVDPNPTVTGKIGKDKSHEALVAAATKKLNYATDWKDEPEQRTAKYLRRAQLQRSAYYDLRWHGKCTCAPDTTHADAVAHREFELVTPGYTDPTRDYTAPPATKPAQTYREKRWYAHLEGVRGGSNRSLSESEVLSSRALKRSAENNGRIKKRQQTSFLEQDAEQALIQKAHAGDILARHRIIIAHRPLAISQAKLWHAKWDTGDLIQEGMFGLDNAIDSFDPERGYRAKDGSWRRYRFADYAREVVKNVLADFLREQRTVARGDVLAEQDDIAAPATRDIDPPSLECLTIRQRDVIERRYLNGPATRKVIATELAISAERVRQLEQTALAKLRKFGQECIT